MSLIACDSSDAFGLAKSMRAQPTSFPRRISPDRQSKKIYQGTKHILIVHGDIQGKYGVSSAKDAIFASSLKYVKSWEAALGDFPGGIAKRTG